MLLVTPAMRMIMMGMMEIVVVTWVVRLPVVNRDLGSCDFDQR
jgi:hypothetical protein